MKENLDLIFQSMNPKMVMYSVVISMIMGIILILVGFYFKKKNKEWWLVISLIGVTSVIINGIKFLVLKQDFLQ